MKTTLQPVGDSVMVAIPQNLLDQMNLKAGATITLVVHQGCLIVDPHPNPRPRYNLAALLAESDNSEGLWEENREFLAGRHSNHDRPD